MGLNDDFSYDGPPTRSTTRSTPTSRGSSPRCRTPASSSSSRSGTPTTAPSRSRSIIGWVRRRRRISTPTTSPAHRLDRRAPRVEGRRTACIRTTPATPRWPADGRGAQEARSLTRLARLAQSRGRSARPRSDGPEEHVESDGDCPTDRRRPDRRRHHERDARDAAPAARAHLDDPHLRAPRRGRGESSNPWNNAGTGHAALCELNYTPETPDGSDRHHEGGQGQRAVPALARSSGRPASGDGDAPRARAVHHADPAHDLRAGRGERRLPRAGATRRSKDHPLFAGLEYSEDPGVIRRWAPLAHARPPEGDQPIAATRIAAGTDVDFGALTRS